MKATNHTCDVCGKKIHFNAPYVAICYNIENMERDHINQNDVVNVISSEQIFTMCGKCGNKRNSVATTSLLTIGLKSGQPRLN